MDIKSYANGLLSIFKDKRVYEKAESLLKK